MKPSALTVLLSCACAWICTSTARAEIQHTVRPGQSLAVIAKRYKRSVAELAAANGLDEDVQLHGGQVLTVPAEGVVYVTAGQTLSQIARAHNLGFLELAKVNHVAPDATLRIGQRLILPGYSASKRETAGEKRWGKPTRRGVVTMYRIWSGEHQSLALVDSRGRVSTTSQKLLREFLRPRDSKKRKTPNSRLLALLAQVSDHFGGRQLHVVSGYRLAGGLTKDTSQHVAGNAIDFRIPGVPLEELRDYCSHFDNVGVGFYPRTQFVHLDVRKKAARWTDWSLAGQPAILTKPAELDEAASEVAEAAHRHDAEIPEPEEALQPSASSAAVATATTSSAAGSAQRAVAVPASTSSATSTAPRLAAAPASATTSTAPRSAVAPATTASTATSTTPRAAAAPTTAASTATSPSTRSAAATGVAPRLAAMPAATASSATSTAQRSAVSPASATSTATSTAPRAAAAPATAASTSTAPRSAAAPAGAASTVLSSTPRPAAAPATTASTAASPMPRSAAVPAAASSTMRLRYNETR